MIRRTNLRSFATKTSFANLKSRVHGLHKSSHHARIYHNAFVMRLIRHYAFILKRRDCVL